MSLKFVSFVSVAMTVSRSSLRRWRYPLAGAFALLFLHVMYGQRHSSLNLPHVQQMWKPRAPVLRPGDYLDHTRVRPAPQPTDESALNEPDGIGKLHDKRNSKFFLGGTSLLTSHDEGSPQEPVVYDPYPPYNTRSWRMSWRGDFKPCLGPKGTELDRTHPEDAVSVYRGNQIDFPFPIFGSYEALGLDANVCLDRCSRLGIYGFDEGRYDSGCRKPAAIQWDQVNWGELQSQCVVRNANRYQTTNSSTPKTLSRPEQPPSHKMQKPKDGNGAQYHTRSAVLLRSFKGLQWTSSHRQYLRSLIMELSLHSGAEYEVFLLVDARDEKLETVEDIERVQESLVPLEFRNMTILFNEAMLIDWYPKIEEHGAVWQHLQAVQIFSRLNQQFDFVWQLEMDARISGHTYHFLDRVTQFAKQQPRKYLWERNAYYYAHNVYGPWEDFMKMVDHSMLGRENKSVWGPALTEGVYPIGPEPPVSSVEDDQYQWGVEEEAELVTFLPIINPRGTGWPWRNMLYKVSEEIPRRSSPVTMWRMSRELLNVMHADLERGMSVTSEMSAPTWALLHGLKAVHVPHPVYFDGQWGARELTSIYNNGEAEKINGFPEKSWNGGVIDHVLLRSTFMWAGWSSEDLYRPWLGFTDVKHGSDRQDEDKFGRNCYPLMFLHPVKLSDLER